MKLKKSIVASIAAATVLLGGGTAYAFVVAKGNGNSNSKVANPTFTMTVTPAAIAALAPGAAASAFPVTVENTSASNIQVNTIVLSLPAASNCGGTITLTQPTVPATVIAKGATVAFNGATLTMADSATVDQTACMDSTLTITASVNGG
jgi:hypothetical protein